MYYAIMIIGYGKRRRYSIQHITDGGIEPTDGKAYKTEQAARAAAASLGIEIARVGDFYEII